MSGEIQDHLDGPRREPDSGFADQLVILLHGYGADGNDLIGLGDALAKPLPNTLFVAPNAPERCANNPFGFQWFPIPWMDGSSEAEMARSFARSVALLNDYLDEIAEASRIPPERTCLLGFSQGTMMSLHVGPRREEALGGIVGFSGRLLEPQGFAAAVKTRPPVLLVHGDQDPLVPFASMAEARKVLVSAEFDVATFRSVGTAHGIAPDGMKVATEFLNANLKAPAESDEHKG